MDKIAKIEVKELFGKFNCNIKLNAELSKELKDRSQKEQETISVLLSELLQDGLSKRGIEINHIFINETSTPA